MPGDDSDDKTPDKVGDAPSELDAMQLAYEALVPLTPLAQGRAFSWLGQRLAAEGMHTRHPYA